jgi:hypothetical protein
MAARLNYGWRLFATGMSFVVFGICGMLFSILAYPLVCLWPHAASRQRAVTTVIHYFFRALVAALKWTGHRRGQSSDVSRRSSAALAGTVGLLRGEERTLG